MRILILPALVAVGAFSAVDAITTTARKGGYPGLVKPSQQLVLGIAAEGRLETLTCDRGDRVSKGDVIATLESGVEHVNVQLAEQRADSRAQVESAKVKLATAEHRRDQYRQLYESGDISPEEFEAIRLEADLAAIDKLDAEEQLARAEIELQRAHEELARRRILAPADGIIVARHLGPGELVLGSEGRKVVTMAVLDPLYIEVIVPAEKFDAIHPGDQATVHFEGRQFENHAATATIVDPIIDAASGTLGVRLELPNPDYAIPSGLKVTVDFDQK